MRRSRIKSDESTQKVDSEGSWAISYGDMVTLLLTFFILFFSIRPNNQDDKALQASLVATLDAFAKKTESQNKLTHENMNLGTAEGKEMDKTVLDKMGAKVHVLGSKVIIEFKNISFFGFGKIELTAQGDEALTNIAQVYIPFAGTHLLGIRAYTDNKPVRQIPGRRFKDNLELSALRAIASMRVLQKAGIPLMRMRIGGFGELKLTSDDLARMPTSTREDPGVPLARRVVLVIEPDIKERLVTQPETVPVPKESITQEKGEAVGVATPLKRALSLDELILAGSRELGESKLTSAALARHPASVSDDFDVLAARRAVLILEPDIKERL